MLELGTIFVFTKQGLLKFRFFSSYLRAHLHQCRCVLHQYDFRFVKKSHSAVWAAVFSREGARAHKTASNRAKKSYCVTMKGLWKDTSCRSTYRINKNNKYYASVTRYSPPREWILTVFTWYRYTGIPFRIPFRTSMRISSRYYRDELLPPQEGTQYESLTSIM